MNILKALVLILWVVGLTAAGAFTVGFAIDYDEAPIHYSTMPADDPVARLIKRLDAGQTKLTWDHTFGWLPSLLKELKIPVSSQVLVYSKTSLQRERISPDTPRALYFNDETYIGMVQYGDVLEISSTDPRQGTMFYILSQRNDQASSVVRQTHECLQCHDSNNFTGGVPGLVVRSVYTGVDGRPVLTAGSHITDQRSPWENRWGGWYVTGEYGDLPHLGNQVFSNDVTPETVNRQPSTKHSRLDQLIDTSPYLSAHSDVVALMVLVHQAQMHNLLTRASYEARKALSDDSVMNAALGRPVEFRSDTAKRRIAHVGEALLRHLLFVDEMPITAPIRGSSTFSADFQAAGPRDKHGRSLRQLDLQTRLLRFPCSYLIYSESFAALPSVVQDFVLQRLLQILTGVDQSSAFGHISAVDRRAILEIIVATKKVLPPAYAEALSQ